MKFKFCRYFILQSGYKGIRNSKKQTLRQKIQYYCHQPIERFRQVLFCHVHLKKNFCILTPLHGLVIGLIKPISCKQISSSSPNSTSGTSGYENCNFNWSNCQLISRKSSCEKLAALKYLLLKKQFLRDQTMNYLTENNILYRYQSRFRKNHSTDTSLSYLKDQILKRFDSDLLTGVILIYL